MAGMGEKRAIDDVASSSSDLASKKGKTVLNDCPMDDALMESCENDEFCPDLATVIKTLKTKYGRTGSDDEEAEDGPDPETVIKSLEKCGIDDDRIKDRNCSDDYWYRNGVRGYYKFYDAMEDKIHIKEYQLFFKEANGDWKTCYGTISRRFVLLESWELPITRESDSNEEYFEKKLEVTYADYIKLKIHIARRLGIARKSL